MSKWPYNSDPRSNSYKLSDPNQNEYSHEGVSGVDHGEGTNYQGITTTYNISQIQNPPPSYYHAAYQNQVPPPQQSGYQPQTYNYYDPTQPQGRFIQGPTQGQQFHATIQPYQLPIVPHSAPSPHYHNDPRQGYACPNPSFFNPNTGQSVHYPPTGVTQHPYQYPQSTSDNTQDHPRNTTVRSLPATTVVGDQLRPHEGPPPKTTNPITLPESEQMKSSSTDIDLKRIIIFGETGTGKSSLVNMLLNSESATTSSSSLGCTFTHKMYSNSKYCFYDTVGLGEGSAGTVSASQAIKMLVKLLKSTKEGIHLLIYVLRKGRITKHFESNYNLFYKAMCNGNVKIILVVTHCEQDADPHGWWDAEKHVFEDRYKMKFDHVICGCAANGNVEGLHPAFKELTEKCYADTRSNLISSVEKYSKGKPWKPENWLEWVKSTVRSAFSLLSLKLGWFGNYDIDSLIMDEMADG